MVYYQRPNLDRTFAALADPTRRALLVRLSEKENVSVSELAEPFSMSLPAVMKHLDVLSDARLIGREKNGRIVSCRLRAEPMHPLTSDQRHQGQPRGRRQMSDRGRGEVEREVLASHCPDRCRDGC